MSENKDNKLNTDFAFGKENYLLMGFGTFLTIVGYFMLSGGSSDDPTVFSEELFNTRRMYISPLIILLGLCIVGWGILKKNK